MAIQDPALFTPDARFLLGLSQLTLALGGELTGTIGDMHGEIRRSTPLGLLPESTSIANRVYGLLGKGFELPGQLLGKAGKRLPAREVDTTTLNIQAAINALMAKGIR